MRKDLGPVEKRIDKHIGAKLALLRHERNLSQEELGGILELSQATIHHYEKGNDRISASRLLSIARALESNIAYFYEGAPEWDGVGTTASSETIVPQALQLVARL